MFDPAIATSWHIIAMTSTAIKAAYYMLNTHLSCYHTLHLLSPSKQSYFHGIGKWYYHPHFTYEENEVQRGYMHSADWSHSQEVLELRPDPMLGDCSIMVQNVAVILTEVIPICWFYLWHYVHRMYCPEPPWLIWYSSPILTCHIIKLQLLYKNTVTSLFSLVFSSNIETFISDKFSLENSLTDTINMGHLPFPPIQQHVK